MSITRRIFLRKRRTGRSWHRGNSRVFLTRAQPLAPPIQAFAQSVWS